MGEAVDRMRAMAEGKHRGRRRKAKRCERREDNREPETEPTPEGSQHAVRTASSLLFLRA
jgi:hypothetical protein